MSLTPIKTKKVIRAIVRRKKQVDHFMIITKYHLAQKKQFILLVEKKNIFHHKFSQTLFFSILFIYFFLLHINTTHLYRSHIFQQLKSFQK